MLVSAVCSAWRDWSRWALCTCEAVRSAQRAAHTDTNPVTHHLGLKLQRTLHVQILVAVHLVQQLAQAAVVCLAHMDRTGLSEKAHTQLRLRSPCMRVVNTCDAPCSR